MASSYRFEETLKDNIRTTELRVEANGKLNLYRNDFKIMELTPNHEVYEHLGFFHELSKKLKMPYQQTLDAFEKHYRHLVSTSKTKAKNDA